MWTRTGEPLNPHRLLARQEEGEVAVLAREENFLDGGWRAGWYGWTLYFIKSCLWNSSNVSRKYLINLCRNFVVGLRELWDFVTPVVDTKSAPLVSVSWPDLIQCVSFSKLCSKYICMASCSSPFNSLHKRKECGTQGKMIASYDAPRKRVCFPSWRCYMLYFTLTSRL